MTHNPSTATLTDLQRERDDLMKAIAEDNDWHGRDHLPNGRWPMVHSLERRINALTSTPTME